MMLTQKQQHVKEAFIDAGGIWSPAWDSILRLDAGFLEAYSGLAAVPWKKNHLENKVKSFIAIAADAAATHLYAPGVQEHLRAAIRHGATAEELMEVLELISTVGIHASNVGVPVLLEVLEEEGLRNGPATLDARREALKDSFVKNRGYWHSSWEGLLELDPELFDALAHGCPAAENQGTDLLRLRCCRHTLVCSRPQAAYAKRVALWRDGRGNHGDAGDRQCHWHTRCAAGCAVARASTWRGAVAVNTNVAASSLIKITAWSANDVLAHAPAIFFPRSQI
jgi:alkylhydroperoxidase/carboxymuconolactone decarboxylase family protein YurZ